MSKQLLQRYDNFFGTRTSQKLLEAKRKYSNNQFIRVNKSKTSNKLIEEFLKKNRVKFTKTYLPNSFKIEKTFFNLSSAPQCILGEFYLQDLASQIPVNCIDFSSLPKKVKVLDIAASPGSKTTQIADILKSKEIAYDIIALEPETKRLTKLINNIQKQSFENINIINSTGQDFKTSTKFDIILLDAPCSGNLVGDRDWLNKRDLKGIQNNANLQKQLLKNAASLLVPNGILIYSTCSLEIEENEENALWAQQNLGLKSFLPTLKFPFETDSFKLTKNKKYLKLKSIRIMPYLSQTQGFFVCCFKRN